ncbi:MAG: tRNA (adenosine(37)-N6)-threonylcarbamoyltransferase complex transferase subunit TsaD [Candidatus Omnitrophica bacterium]|jgi:N6-L-threonylcarbamoyladenine synthase|nr:tRNA (adenosine(37)-N6)-threonylcarbamoyltransferase complex transferase subunit TsaD [Candidatus Omnitrophota bacterium]
MIALGIETSCDETSVAVVKDARKILSNEVASSIKFHKQYGGVIPEIASRMQLETISEVAASALREAGIKLNNIDLISVTCGPGLLGSLLVGISFAKALSLSLGIPLLGVNHVHSHFYANFLQGKIISLPFVALVVSGGHTSLFYVRDFDKIEVLGETYDDACGEAFDKVAKILGLGYPGGPLIERLALRGDPKSIKFNCSGTKNVLDFSFSGIKTAVLYHIRKLEASGCGDMDKQIRNICASFQYTVVETLAKKAILACKMKKVKSLLLGGGVVANKALRERLASISVKEGLGCHLPSLGICMDNAAMVAGFASQLFKKGYRSNLYLNTDLN